MEKEVQAGPQQPADKVIKSGWQAGGGEVAMDDQASGEGVPDLGVDARDGEGGEEGDREGAADSFVAALLQRQANLEEEAAGLEGMELWLEGPACPELSSFGRPTSKSDSSKLSSTSVTQRIRTVQERNRTS